MSGFATNIEFAVYFFDATAKIMLAQFVLAPLHYFLFCCLLHVQKDCFFPITKYLKLELQFMLKKHKTNFGNKEKDKNSRVFTNDAVLSHSITGQKGFMQSLGYRFETMGTCQFVFVKYWYPSYLMYVCSITFNSLAILKTHRPSLCDRHHTTS